MKTTRIIKAFGLGSFLALAIGLGNLAFAGPGPQYWQQMDKIRAENAAKAKAAKAAVPAAKPAVAPAMACPHCKIKVLWEPSTNLSGKATPHSSAIGKTHSCDGCSGVVTVARGKVTDEMKRNCPICAAAAPTCCSVNS